MRGSKLFAIILALLAFISSASLKAQPGGFPSPPPGGEFPFADDLNLSKEQKDQIKALHEANRAQFDKYREAMQQAKKALDESLEGDMPDEEVHARFQAFQNAQQAMMAFGFDQALAIRKILTPEQRKKFNQLRAEKWKKMPHPPQGPMGPGPGPFPPPM